VKNGDETGVDCGGSCPPCGPGQPCTTAADCQPPATCNVTLLKCETTCVITAACLAEAEAAGLPVRCCNGTCVAGRCCTNADCPGSTPACVDHICRLCSPTTPGCTVT
jgi:hypothetical protein